LYEVALNLCEELANRFPVDSVIQSETFRFSNPKLYHQIFESYYLNVGSTKHVLLRVLNFYLENDLSLPKYLNWVKESNVLEVYYGCLKNDVPLKSLKTFCVNIMRQMPFFDVISSPYWRLFTDEEREELQRIIIVTTTTTTVSYDDLYIDFEPDEGYESE
jgi:hypothetical protein